MGKSARDEVDMRCATFVPLKGGRESNLKHCLIFFYFYFFPRTALQRYLGKGCIQGALGSL